MLVQHMPERRPSSGNPPGMLASNNPFRRAASPNPPSPVKPSVSVYPPPNDDRTMSRNPFLDPSPNAANSQRSQDQATSQMADDIFFKDLSVLDRAVSNGAAPRQPAPARGGPVPPRPSREDDRRPVRPPPSKGERNLLDSPDKPRPRRNSESSVMDKEKHDEDRRRRERRRERERREREGKPSREGKSSRSKDGKTPSSSSKLKKPHGLDVIDKLDVTGIYGQGLFHHDGPFDACNPHRNRKHNNHAPMTAFAEGSANNALSGGAPKTFDYDNFHGRGEEGFADFASSAQQYTTVPQYRRPQREQITFNPTDKAEQIHGQASVGLGTSTFLEGAPATKSAMQRRVSEREDVPQTSQGNMGGIGRKKSLAMRIRGISNPRQPGDLSSGKVTTPDGYDAKSPSGASMSAGGPLRARPRKDEKNPFFQTDYDNAYDKKGAQIREAEADVDRPRAGSSPRGNELTRSVTADSGNPYGEGVREDKSGGGFLSRMRSIKGGKRARPERRVS